MQILLISGFLGAGKTEFIKTLVGATRKQCVVLENEYGEINFDSGRLKDIKTPDFQDVAVDVEELTEGCICCSMNLDVSLSILTIANSLDPDLLILEPSGVALSSRLLAKIEPILYERIGLLEPIVILDGQHYPEAAQNFPTYLRDQLETASTLLVSKSESWTAMDYRALRKELDIPDHVLIPESHYSTWRDRAFHELLERPLIIDGKAPVKVNPEPPSKEHLDHITFPDVRVASPYVLVSQLEALIHGHGGDVVRAKGQVRCGTEILTFDLVGGSYAVEGEQYGDETGVVVIGRNLNHEKLEYIFT